MKPKDKQLVLKDLCARLPYGVKAQVLGWDEEKGEVEVPLKIYSINTDGYVYFKTNDYDVNYLPVEDVRPFLRPMSSMTEEEHNEWFNYYHEIELKEAKSTGDYLKAAILGESASIDWLNKNMFDFRGLIPEGLAEIAPEGMYELKLLNNHLSSQNESDPVIDNTPKITVGCKIRSKTKPNVILSIISDDCHGDEFECSNGSVLSLKQIEKYYELIK